MSSASERRNVVLTGFMGTGKSTVGRALAQALGFELIDTDAMIVERHGTIAQIFERGGEGAFRQLERDTAVELAGRSGCVISTGGRFMLDDHNAAVLTPSSDVFALVAEPEEIARRVLKDGIASRPLLADAKDPVQRIKDLVEQRRAGCAHALTLAPPPAPAPAPATSPLAARLARYARFSTVRTDGREPGAIVAEILQRRKRQALRARYALPAVAAAAVGVALLVLLGARGRLR